MIPRFKPSIEIRELAAACLPKRGSVAAFEREFAVTFGATEAVAFPYGRTALWTLFKALDIAAGEVILPSYTCVVVAHAIVLSGNTCRFVDVSLRDYNMDLDQVAAAITGKTRAIIATHLFGYPLDCDRLATMVREAEARFGHRIYVIHDCAHSFGARWRGRLVTAEGDAALFGLGVSKLMTSIVGGMLISSDATIAARLRALRRQTLRPAGWLKSSARQLYLAAIRVAFSAPFYRFVHWLEHRTTVLDTMAKAYHLDDIIHFPPDHLDAMTDVEAGVGLVQLRRYDAIVARHVEHAKYYDVHLRGIDGWVLPPIVEGATYSHYVIRVPDRDGLIRQMARRGIDLGELIQYSVPHMPRYRELGGGQECANSLLASQHTINLPVSADLTDADRARIVAALREAAAPAETRHEIAS